MVAWVGSNAKVGTHFRNVVQFAGDDPRIATLPLSLEPVRMRSFDRYLRLVPASAREISGTLPLYRRRDVDVVWSQRGLTILPWLLTVRGWQRTPVVYSIDATMKQLNDFGPFYSYMGGRRRTRFAARNAVERMLMQRMTLIVPWSEWVARSVREDYGISEDRIRILPPGIDLDFWRPAPERRDEQRLPRAVFVGGDFERKGGDTLLEVFRRRFRGRLELDIVTRDPVPEEPGVRVHTGLAGKDPRLLRLYQSADLFVLPTRAECFSMATLEALACGLPVILGRTGAGAEMLEHRLHGYLIEPGDKESLTAPLEQLASDPTLRRQMSTAARSLAERRYDARQNTRRLTDLLLDVAQRPPGPSQS